MYIMKSFASDVVLSTCAPFPLRSSETRGFSFSLDGCLGDPRQKNSLAQGYLQQARESTSKAHQSRSNSCHKVPFKKKKPGTSSLPSSPKPKSTLFPFGPPRVSCFDSTVHENPSHDIEDLRVYFLNDVCLK